MPSVKTKIGMNINLEDHLNTAIKAAIAGGREIMEVYKTDFQVAHKADESPLTEADRRAHHAIKAHLDYTQAPMLSEEGAEIPYEERKNWEAFWMVDPLDGTKEFVKRNGEFTVNIAWIGAGVPVMGIIFVPVLQELYVGWMGKGAYWLKTNSVCSWEEIQREGTAIPKTSETNKAFTVVGSRSHMSPETEAFMNGLKEEHGTIEVLSRGSSLKLCMVAEGKAQVYPRFAPTMEWDTAAGHAICRAAGFRVTHHNADTELQYNKPNLLNPWFIVQP